MLIQCMKEGKVLADKNFYKKKDGTYTKVCKNCLCMHANVFKPETIIPLCKELDIPFVEEEWNTTVNKDYAKNGEIKSTAATFGKYVAKMKLIQWNKYCFADTEKIKAEKEERIRQAQEENKQYQEGLLSQLESGQISEYEYQVMASAETQESNKEKLMQDPTKFSKMFNGGGDNYYDENQFISEDELSELSKQLTQEEKIKYAIKWGRLYKPMEWLQLEKKYEEFTRSFTIDDADTETSLTLICKTWLKMTQALDAGDIDSYQKLSRVYEGMRKTAKFTAAQNKDDKNNKIDSVGQLIVICEKDGFIPRFATDIPQDKVDFTLKDLENYNKTLVTQELGFGDQIEAAIKKLQMKKEEDEAADAAEDEEIANELNDKDFQSYFDAIEKQKEMDYAIYAPDEEEEDIDG